MSEPNRRLSLSPAGESNAATAVQANGTTVRPRHRGVLVVDDQHAVREVVTAGLRYHGFEVWAAADGVDAIAVYGAHSEGIDAVMLDVRMPGRDGPQTLAALRETTPDLPCCFMSGDLGEYTEAGLRDLGSAVVIRKPFTTSEAASRIHGLCEAADRNKTFLYD